MKITISDTLHSLLPNQEFIISNESYEGIVWINLPTDAVIPTKEEVEAEVLRLQEEYDKLEYQRLRKKEYPSIEDQLDILYHQGYDGWKSQIDIVKNKYPKPEEL